MDGRGQVAGKRHRLEHARYVIELFAGIFTDTLEGTATLAVAVVRLVMDRRAWKLRRQRCALGLLTHIGFDSCRLHRIKLRFDSGDIGVNHIVEQAGLIPT